jgi:diguanylate cyclase (GGDEF)-like protein
MARERHFLQRFSFLTHKTQQVLLILPAIASAILLHLILLGYAFLMGLRGTELLVNGIFALSGLSMTLAGYATILPAGLSNPRRWRWPVVVLNACIILLGFSFHDTLMPGYSATLGVILIVITALIFGRPATYVLFGLAALGSTAAALAGWLKGNQLWMEAGPLLIVTAVLNETLLRLQQFYLSQAEHLRTLNKAAENLASTIELRQVINIICSIIQQAVHADAYYMGLVQGDRLRLELVYDNSEYYPPAEIPLEGTLAHYVIRQKCSLLINDMEQQGMLYLSNRYLDRAHPARSWLSVPMISGGEIIGIIGVAAYRKNAFSQQDQHLLENIARQAAMAIDNARHHQEVEQRSRLDSLTEVLNHKAFLEALESTLTRARALVSPVRLIMLYIDFFKAYNDSYGHLLGDHLLKTLTHTIRQNIKSTDLVGRWGGEEFAIALPNATGVQAFNVAQRIAHALATSCLFSREGKPVDPPTISQGIAVFPGEASDAYSLIDLADQRLYIAKSRGRNQIEPQPSSWQDAPLLQVYESPSDTLSQRER